MTREMGKGPTDLLEKLTIVLPVIAILVATGLISGTAYSASATNVLGAGHGTVTCPNGQQGEASIEFQASVSNGKVSGGFDVFSGSGIGFLGIIDAGSMTTSRYNLGGTITGTITSFLNCFAPFLPTSVTIHGKCGTGVRIHLSAANGIRGTFAGSVTCT